MSDALSVFRRRLRIAVCFLSASAACIGLALWWSCDDAQIDVAASGGMQESSATKRLPAQATVTVEASRQEEEVRDPERLKSFARTLPAATQLLGDDVLNPQGWHLDSSATDELNGAITALNARRAELEEQYASLADQVALKRLEGGDGELVANGLPRDVTEDEAATRGRVMVLARADGPPMQVVVSWKQAPELKRVSSQLDDLAVEAYDRVDEILREHGKHDR